MKNIILLILFLVQTTVSSQNCKYKLYETKKSISFTYPKYYFKDNMFKVIEDTLSLYTTMGKLDLISHGYKTDDILQEQFIYKGFVKQINVHLIEVKGYESTNYLLVSQLNAVKIKMWNYPIFNKVFTRIAAFSGNLDYDAIPNGIQIFNIRNKEISKSCEILFSDFEIENLSWAENKKLYIKVSRYKNRTKPPKDYYLIYSSINLK